MLTVLIEGGTKEERASYLNSHYPSSQFSLKLETQDSSIKINDVRSFIKDINYLPPESDLHLHYIIDAHKLTLPSQHALLKTLEEPPKRIQVVLTVDTKSHLLETIISRCQLIQLKTKTKKTSDPLKLIKQISTSNPAQLTDLASKMKDHSELKTELLELLVFLKDSTINNFTKDRLYATKLINQTIQDLDTNINQQLLLENLLFKLNRLRKR